MRFAAALLVLTLAAPPMAQAREKHPDRSAALQATTDGATKETAYKVDSVDEEYRIVRARHLRPSSQSLIIGDDKRPYDVLDVTDEAGKSFRLWFDIQSFYGHALGF